MPDLYLFFKSIIDNDSCPVVICNTDHIIIYMNPAAIENYAKRGGEKLLGKSLLDCHNENSSDLIKKTVAWFSKSPENNLVHTGFNQKRQKDIYMVALRNGSGNLIGYYEKHEVRTVDSSPFYSFE